ncbi:hypothetical protein OC834_003634 [Tilletia horrida]|nr:hypothetical protein OC834_003634 [Tilletia horrida]
MARNTSASASGTGLVLAIDVQLDQLSALVFDPLARPPASPPSHPNDLCRSNTDALVHCALWQRTVRFDDFVEFQTKRGSYKPASFDEDLPRNFALTPVGVIVRAVDVLLQDLADAEVGADDHEPATEPGALMSRIGTVGISGAVNVPIALSSTAEALLASLRPDKALSTQLGCPSFFAGPFIPNAKDWTLESEALTIQDALTEYEALLAQATSGANGLVAPADEDVLMRSPPQPHPPADSQRRTAKRELLQLRFAAALLRFRLAAEGDESNPISAAQARAWQCLGHITSLGGLVTTLLTGAVSSWSLDEAALTALYDVRSSQWDEALLSVIGGCPAPQLAAILGAVEQRSLPATRKLSSWVAQRFCFPSDCRVVLSVSSHVALANACMLESNDGIVQLGLDDTLVVAIDAFPESLRGTMVPLPRGMGVDAAGRGPKYLVISQYEDAGLARQIVRGAYCNDRWSVLNRLINAVPVGGSIGLDDKLFTRVVSKCGIQDIRRYERGCRVTEFSDLRANARCLLEGQALSIRADLIPLRPGVRLHGPPKIQIHHGAAGLLNGSTRPARAPRLFAFGKPAGNKTIASILSAALGSPLQIPSELLHVRDDADDEDAVRSGHGHGYGRRTQSSSASEMSVRTSSFARGIPEAEGDERPPAACRLLLGTALHALATCWNSEHGIDEGDRAPFHPGVIAALAYFGKNVSLDLDEEDASSHSTAGRDDDNGGACASILLDCKQVAFMELSNVYAALAEEHSRLHGVGDIGQP